MQIPNKQFRSAGARREHRLLIRIETNELFIWKRNGFVPRDIDAVDRLSFREQEPAAFGRESVDSIVREFVESPFRARLTLNQYRNTPDSKRCISPVPRKYQVPNLR